MRKKREFVKPWDWNTWRKMLIIPKLLVGLLGLLFLALPFDTYAQERTKVTLDLKNVTLNEMFEEMKKQTDYDFFYNSQLLRARGFISVKADNEEVTSVLDRVLPGVNLEYQMNNNLVTIRAKKAVEQQQVNFVQVKGRVTDEKGNPLPGAAVIIHGTTQGVSTDMEGHYTLNVRPDDVLKFSFIGYKEEVRPVQGQTTINVGLQPTAENLEEVQVVAFGTQKKESVVSAITTIRPTELRSSSSDLTTQLTGKIAGIVGWQTGGLPGALTEDEMNTQFYVRGVTSFMGSSEPLILLDGVETSRGDLARVPVEDIESFSVLKDASATAMYGARGANGVIMLTTKKGEEGSVYTSVRYEAVFSEPTRKIDVVDPVTYMRMYNRALLSRTPGATPKYSVERINRTQSGKYPSFVYPANDWYDILFKDYSVNHRAGISLRGGSKLIQYYASLNYNRDVGMIKTDKLNDFDCNIINNQYSFRTNLTIDLKAGIQLLINSSATIDKYNGPLESQEQAYYAAFSASPTDFAPTYPGDDTYNWPHIRFGKENEESKNPYLEIQKGYVERTRYSTINRAEYIQNLSSLVKGLELRASVSYSQTGLYASSYSSTPYEYALKEYDFETGKHTLEALNADKADRTLTLLPDYPLTESQMTYELRLLHTAAWGEHQTSLTGVAQMQEQTSGGSNQDVLEAMPRRNMTFSMRGTYGYKNRYFAEASFGYNGSERFAEGNRFGFFPSVGAAWVISNEPFMQSVYNWLPYLKLRASWGQVGNDGIIETPRFVFLPDIKTREGAYVDPSPGGGSIQRYYISSYPNDNIKWEIAEQVNLGLETQFFDGIVELNIDAYQEIRRNIISSRLTVPASMGLEVAPLDNVGSTRSRGIDFLGKVQHMFNNESYIILNGTLTYNKTVYRDIEEATNVPDWQRKKGKEISQNLGYIAEGLFRDQAEIDHAPTQSGDVMPGDIRYRDVDGNGIIDVNDAVFVGFPETPRLIYGFSGFAKYKDWEFSFSFQGSGKRGFFMDPSKMSPFYGGKAMLKAIAEDHWNEDNMARHAFWPRLSTYNITYHNPEEDWYNTTTDVRKSTFFMRECRFLRCTSLELAYNMPKRLMDKWGLSTARFFVRTNNPFLISNFKVWDVELGEDGFNYPIQRTYSVGLTVSF